MFEEPRTKRAPHEYGPGLRGFARRGPVVAPIPHVAPKSTALEIVGPCNGKPPRPEHLHRNREYLCRALTSYENTSDLSAQLVYGKTVVFRTAVFRFKFARTMRESLGNSRRPSSIGRAVVL